MSKFFNCLFGLTLFLTVFLFSSEFVQATAPLTPVIESIVGNTLSPTSFNDKTPDVVVSGLTIGNDVKVYSGGTEVGSIIGVGATTVTVTTSSLNDGAHSFTAISYEVGTGDASSPSNAFVYNLNTVLPTIVISSGATNPTGTSPIPITFTFSKPVTGFTSGSIVIGNGTTGVLTTTDNTIFTMNVVPSADGLMTVDVGPSVATDQYGNQNTAASQFAITFDSSVPSAPTIYSVDGQTTTPISSANPTPTIVVNGLTVGDTLKIYSGGVLVATQTNVGATSVSITTPTLSQGVNSLTAKDVDNANNSSIASNIFVYTLDSVAPSVIISAGVSNPTNVSTIPITVTFSEPVTGFTIDDIVVGNGSTDVLTTTDNTVYHFNIIPTANGLITVDVGSSVAQDGAGHGNVAASQFSISYDNIAPAAPSIYSVGGILVSPASNNLTSPDIVLNNVTSGDIIKVFVDSIVVIQTNIGATNITLTIPTLTAGSHTIIATATDQAGNISANSNTFVYSADPTMANQPIINSVDGSTVSPVVSNDPTPDIVVSNLTIGDDLRIYSGGNEVASIIGVGDTRLTIATSTLPQGVYSITAIAYAAGTGNASNVSNSFTLTIDLSGPTVTKIGDGVSDYVLSAGSTATLVFNRSIGQSSKTAIENAISAGADNAPTLIWNGNSSALTITAGSSPSTFANDVRADVVDINGNTSVNSLLIDSIVDSNQIDASSNVSVNSTQSQVVITGSAATSITVPSDVVNATLNVDSLVLNNSATLPAIDINSATSIGTVSFSIPTQTVITSDSGWNGIINLPVVRANNSVTVTPEPDRTAAISTVIEVGADDLNLTFSKGVRINIAGQGNKSVGFYRNGVFTQISSLCSADSQFVGDALSAGGNCGITVGSDMVIWTKHFTRFITYSQSRYPDTGSNNNSGPSGPPGAPSCGNQMPGGTPVLFRIDRVNNKTVKLHFTPTSGPNTYYYIAYGKTAGSETYGTTFNMGDYPGEISFNIGNLASNANYFFKVRGGNGCMPGYWSNNLSIKEKNIKVAKPAPAKKTVRTSPLKK